MESRIEDISKTSPSPTTEKIMTELRTLIDRAQEKAVERAKAADRIVRDHPYQTIGLAFGLGLLIGVLARRK
jgi:ElaB/YqjD/DUF883 family membrane-anchored ribosome-binding protein